MVIILLKKNKFHAITLAPRGFQDKVFMVWLKEIDGEYKVSDKIEINILGGRRKGFRGLSYKNNISEGRWQARIETKDDLEIGRFNFRVINEKDDQKREFIESSFE